MSIKAIADNVNFNRMINLALGGYEGSAIQVLNLCDLSKEQKAIIERIIKKPNIKDFTPSKIKQKIIKKLDSSSVAESNDLCISKKSTSCSEITLNSANEYSATIFSSFPKELFLTIMANLPVKSARILGLTCTTMHAAAREDDLWRFFCERDFQITPSKDESSLELYRRYSFNISNGVYASKTLKGHESYVTCNAINNGMLYSASFAKPIKVWDLESCECIKTFDVGEFSVFSIAIENQKLYLGSDDGKIQIWNLETMKCEMTMNGHKARVTCLITNEGKLYSSSTDQESPLKVWDLETMDCLHTLTGSLGGIRAFVLRGSKIIANSSSQRIQVWDLSIREKRLSSFLGHNQRVFSLVIYENKLISASSDQTIKIWDLDSMECLDTLTGHYGMVSLALAGKYLISGAGDSIIKIWDLETNQCLVSLEGQKQRTIINPKLNNGKVYASIGPDIECFDFTAKDEIIIEEIKSEIEIADCLYIHEEIHHAKKIAEQRLARMQKPSNDKI